MDFSREALGGITMSESKRIVEVLKGLDCNDKIEGDGNILEIAEITGLPVRLVQDYY